MSAPIINHEDPPNKQPFVNTNVQHVRKDVPENLIDLAFFLQQRGWALNITTETRVDEGLRMAVHVECNEWLGLPVVSYRLGYLTNDMQESTVIQTARKLTELVLQLKETFHDSFPAEEVSLDGCIYESRIRTTAAQSGALALITAISEERKSKDINRSNGIYFKYGFIHIQWDAQNMIVEQSNLNTLGAFIREHYSG